MKVHEKGHKVFNKICGKVVKKWQNFESSISNYMEI